MIIFLIWYLIGYASFYFWWTREFKLTLPDVLLSFFVGITGPFAWIFGYIEHSKRTNLNFFGMKK